MMSETSESSSATRTFSFFAVTTILRPLFLLDFDVHYRDGTPFRGQLQPAPESFSNELMHKPHPHRGTAAPKNVLRIAGPVVAVFNADVIPLRLRLHAHSRGRPSMKGMLDRVR